MRYAIFQYIDDIKISSVVCDERYDNAVIRVDKNGFHPAVYYIQKSQSVMWVWKGGEDEAHNVIHVKSPDSDVSAEITQNIGASMTITIIF